VAERRISHLRLALLVVGRGWSAGASGPGGSGVGSAVARKEGDKSLSAVGGTSQCTMNFTGHKDFILSVAVSHDGAWIVLGSKDRSVWLSDFGVRKMRLCNNVCCRDIKIR